MISIIEEHNLLTGYRFVIVEYLLVGLLVGLLAQRYAVVGRPLDAVIWLGISVNSAVIVLLADATAERRPRLRQPSVPEGGVPA